MRENETECLNKIIDSYFHNIGIINEFDNSNPLIISKIFKTFIRNNDSSIFPDFFFDGGIIEHFEVTSSVEGRKGSAFRMAEATDQKENDKFFEQLDSEFRNSEYRPGTYHIETRENIYECFSYESFVESFKKNTLKHIDSLNKSPYTNGTVVFLIEQRSGRLGIYENGIFNRFYRVYEDKNILLFIKEYLANVNYIFFTAIGYYEILDLSKIDNLILKAKANLDIRGARHINLIPKVYLDL